MFFGLGFFICAARTAALAAPPPVSVPTQAPAPIVTSGPGTSGPTAAPLGTPAPTPPPTGRRLAAFSLDADRIDFYSNRFIVGADGHVSIVLGDGTRLSGNTFSMDLRLNRFVIAGNVKLISKGVETDGAAYSAFLDFDRAYFLPIITEPDRWTYTEGDYQHPLFGRLMPGDVFNLPDDSGDRVYLSAKRAIIEPKESVRFKSVEFNFGAAYVHFPTYFLDFSKNPNFAQNSLAGADVDGPYDFAGGDHGLATLHLRYDSANKLYFAYEQHQFSDNHYIVFSVNPITRPGKQYDFIAYDRTSPTSQVQVNYQEFTFQHAFTQPLSASGFASIQLTQALPHSFFQLTTDSYYQSLLGQPKGIGRNLFYGDISHLWIPDHPAGATLSWNGFRHKINRLPISFQLRSSIGVNHNGISTLNQTSGLMSLGGVEYDTEWNKAFGLTLLTDQLVLVKDRRGLRRNLYFTGNFDKQRTYYSIPHHTDVTTTTLSLTKVIDPRHLTALFTYTNTNIADFYGAQQSLAYPATVDVSPATNQLYPQYLSFRGFGTTRSYREALVFSPSTALNTSLTMREDDDFPVAVPGIAETVGNTTFFNNYGVPPKQLTLDVRFRINPLLTLDVSRSYFFNFGGYQGYSPTFNVQVVK